ncbi:MAG: NAD-dependent epimerase/dehydratase family protein [Chloroflexi bacterium]|jgi:2'-hydroxyisoflavone reductase|nr:NAD-dependent epimerase/dehydratase family protein [Chloroflexota bacterium]
MKLLIIGGTRFLGRAIVDAALANGHRVTLFNRGQSNPELYSELELLQGHRDGGLGVLRDRRWDAVIDTCGYVPRLVRDSAKLLADAVDHYTFISTISVYAEPVRPGTDEDAALAHIEDSSVEEVTAETYGPLKVLCEQAVDEEMNGRALIVRAGLLVGPFDQSDRFTYWPYRVAHGGEVLAPGKPQAAIQFIDVRDIAQWTVKATENRVTGPFNVTGPAETLSMLRILENCHTVSDSDASFTWVGESFLVVNDVAPFTELPLWVPDDDAGILQVNIGKALRAGLSFRSLSDTLDWSQSRPAGYEWLAGISLEREVQLLEQWHAAQ